VVSSTPQPHFTPGKDPVPIVQETGWASGLYFGLILAIIIIIIIIIIIKVK
jgi:hypothetical protein